MHAALGPDLSLGPQADDPCRTPPQARTQGPHTQWCLPAGRPAPYRPSPWAQWMGRLRRLRSRWRRALTDPRESKHELF